MFGFGGKKYNVKVTTGKAKGAGTNANIKIILVDHEGKQSEEKVLTVRYFAKEAIFSSICFLFQEPFQNCQSI